MRRSLIVFLLILVQLVSTSSEDLNRAVDILQNGGIVAHATETCYGFACDLSNPDAVAKLFRIKKRPLDQPVSALFANIEEAKEYVEWSDEAEELARKYLPGPLTLILPLRSDAPRRLSLVPSPQDVKSHVGDHVPFTGFPVPTLGLRISSSPIAQELVQRFGSPISTTSANIHGEANPYDAQEILKRFKEEIDQPDLILDSGVLPLVPPSTVIDLAGGKTLRKGEISL